MYHHEYMDICAPVKTAKIPYKFATRNKWMTKGLLRSSRKLCKLSRKMTGEHEDSEAVCKYKKYRNLYNRLIRLTKSKYYDICSTWRTLNEIIGKTRDKTSCTSMKIDDQLVSDPEVISTKFCEYFTNVGQKCAAQIPPANVPYTHYLSDFHTHSLFFDPITPGDIISIIGKMKGKKSSGQDDISSKLLKSLKGEIAYPLSILINNSLSNGIVPETIAKVIPLYKAKDQQLLRIIGLHWKKVVHNKLSRYLQFHEILYESQYGFRKHHTTVHGVAEFMHHMWKPMTIKTHCKCSAWPVKSIWHDKSHHFIA